MANDFSNNKFANGAPQDLATIPSDGSSSGFISYKYGFNSAYYAGASIPQRLTRQIFNRLFYDVTAAIGESQQYGNYIYLNTINYKQGAIVNDNATNPKSYVAIQNVNAQTTLNNQVFWKPIVYAITNSYNALFTGTNNTFSDSASNLPVAYGNSSTLTANAQNGVLVGSEAFLDGVGAITIGSNSKATGFGAISVGFKGYAYADRSITIGRESVVFNSAIDSLNFGHYGSIASIASLSLNLGNNGNILNANCIGIGHGGSVGNYISASPTNFTGTLVPSNTTFTGTVVNNGTASEPNYNKITISNTTGLASNQRLYTTSGNYIATITSLVTSSYLLLDNDISQYVGSLSFYNSAPIYNRLNTAQNIGSGSAISYGNNVIGTTAAATSGGTVLLNNLNLGSTPTNSSITLSFGGTTYNNQNSIGIGINKNVVANRSIGIGNGVSIDYSSLNCTIIDPNPGSVISKSGCSALGLGSAAVLSGNDQVQIGGSGSTTYVYGTVQNRSDPRDKDNMEAISEGFLNYIINDLNIIQYKTKYRENSPDFIKVKTITKNEEVNEEYLDEKGNKQFRKVLKDVVHEVKTADWSVDNSKSPVGKRWHFGINAKEVYEDLNALGIDAGFIKNPSRDPVNPNQCDVFSVGYDELIAPLIAIVQKQNKQIASLEIRLARLEAV